MSLKNAETMEVPGNEFVNDNSVNDDSMISNNTMNEQPYDFDKGMGDEGEAMITDEEDVVVNDTLDPNAQAEVDPTGKKETEAHVEASKVTPEFEAMKSEYEAMKAEMAQIQEFVKREDVRKALEPIIKGQQGNPNAQPDASTNVVDGSISLDLKSFTDEEKADPIAFMTAFGARATKMVDMKAAQIAQNYVNQAMSKLVDALTPMIEDFKANRQTKVINDLTGKYPTEINLYLSKGTPQNKALTEEMTADPSLTIEKAFLIARGKFAGQRAQEEAKKLVESKSKMSIPTATGKAPAQGKKSFGSAREAALAAFNE